MGRGDRQSFGSGRGVRKQGGATSIGEPSPRQLADEADSLQQQGERRKGLEAAAKFEAAAAKYQQALEATVRQRQLHGLGLGPADAPGAGRGNVVTLEEAVDMRSSMAECHQLLAEALLAVSAARPDSELSAESERQAAATAAQHLTTALGHYACCHPAAVLTAAAPAAAAASGGVGGDAPPPVFAAAAAAAGAAAAAAAALPPDVAVNAGNCTAALAELLEEEAGRVAAGSAGAAAAWLPLYDITLRCYRAAAACYRSAVAREEDALTLSNLGDVLVQSGTCLYGVARAVRVADPQLAAAALQGSQAAAAATAAEGDADGAAAAAAAVIPTSPAEWAAAREAEAQSDFAAAILSYEAACSMSDSSQGDDLPGLLSNWGAGLLSLAGCMQDPSSRLPLLEQAASRLGQAAAFDRGDPAPLCSLGDTLAAAGEAAEALAEAAAAVGEASADAAAVRHWYGVATAHLRSALDRGYGAALTLRRDEPEALVGCGEAHLALSRIARRDAAAAAAAAGTGPAPDGGGGGGSASDAVAVVRHHAAAAVASLQAAVSRPERLGGWRQRCDVRYNLACALALAGREQESAQLLAALLSCGAVQPAELTQDVDLEPVRHLPWFQALLQT
ncbi:hypothetical protein PLESTM_001290900 [Pleodorina starrii]|nr:hypothetical protein PLESTM_001290900 [Pleodorina starrii]